MFKFLDGIVRGRFYWRDRPLSRRDFLGIVFPFKRETCRECADEPASEGEYCVTCARRKLHAAVPPPQRASAGRVAEGEGKDEGKIGVVVAILAIALLAPLPARALDYQVTTSSYTFFTKSNNALAANKFYVPFYQYMNADMEGLWKPSFSLHVSGFGRGDITSRGYGDRADGELLYGYMQWQDPSSPRRILRVGRQFFFGGPTSLQAQYVDGLYFKSDIVGGLGVEVLGGSPVNSFVGKRGGDFVAQGRAYHVWENKSEIGVGYLISRDGSQRAREDVGIDLWLNPYGKVELLGYGYYDLIGRQIADANLTATFFPIEKLKIDADVGHSVPSALLPHTSLFSIFSTSSYQKVGLAGTFFLNDRWTFDADGQFFRYSEGGKVVRFGGEGSYRYGTDKRGKISLGAHRLDQLQNGATELRAYNSYRFPNKLSCSADLYGYLFDQQTRNRRFSVTAVGSLGYQLLEKLKLTGSFYFSRNPLFNTEYRGLVKVVSEFGGKTGGKAKEKVEGKTNGS